MTHVLSDRCQRMWCRLHWWPAYATHERYPMEVNVLSSRHGWQQVVVHCGPGAFNSKPAKPKEGDTVKTWSLPAEPSSKVTRVRGASGQVYRRDWGSSFWRPVGQRAAHDWRWGTLLANDGPVTEETP